MKKIATAVAAMAMAATMFAVDFSTTVQLKGDIAYGTDETVNFFGFENTNQKDADLLEVHFAGDKAGADFKFWTQAKEPETYYIDGKEGSINVGGQYGDKLNILTVRGLDIWFCPVDAVKITLGNVTSDLYKERLNWWKVPCGASKAAFLGWDHRWSSYSTVEGFGATVNVNLDVLGGLALGCGITSDSGIALAKGTTVIPAYGVQAKLNVADGVSVGVAWRDEGMSVANTDSWNKEDKNGAYSDKILTVGADYAAGDFYGMLQARMYFNNAVDKYWAKPDMGLSGIAIDNYFAYNFGFMKVDGTVPVIIRGIRSGLTDAEKKADPSYMTARIRCAIPMDSVMLNVVFGSDEGTNNGPAGSPAGVVWTLDDTFGDSFNFYINPSVDFNVGVCALNVGAEISINNSKPADKVETAFNWAVPFTAKVAF